MTLALAFPPIDPVFFELGPFEIRWYALAYLTGFILGWRRCMALAYQWKGPVTPKHYDDFLTWVVIGTLIGGRLGYVLFYQFPYYMENPAEIVQIWRGGMSFHGGMLGVIGAAWLFARSRKIPFFAFTDILALVAPIGLFFGRLANFVNGELYGRASDAPWAVIFPHGGDIARHPSQLYEAALEGVLLYLILYAFSRVPTFRVAHGVLSGAFLSGYAILRFIAEFFREPDAQLGFLFAGATMGQLLCIPMFIAGEALTMWAILRYKKAQKP